MKEILIATKNKHKYIEIQRALEPLGYKVLTLFDFDEFPDIIEDKDTFRGNALKKAEELSNYLNKDVIADDSGLEVFSLNNEPGIFSARYSGDDATAESNNQKLLNKLEGISNRDARFVTTMCLYSIGKEPVYFEGYLNGKIATVYKGTNGFGYDPIFIVKGTEKHLAEYGLDEKNKISHRALCLQKLIAYLNN